jgi:hypothetical protein
VSWPKCVVNDEFRAPKDACQTREPNEGHGFFEHLRDGSVGRHFSRLYRTTWQEPNAALRMTHQQHAFLRIAQRDRDGRHMEQLGAANDLAEMPDVLSRHVNVPRRASTDRAVYSE